MRKQITLNLTFEYDTETDDVINYTVNMEGVKQKKTTTTKSTGGMKEVEQTHPIVRAENKLLFSKKFLEMIGCLPDDRIDVRFEKNSETKEIIPIIGRDLLFGDIGCGNRLTKSNSISYRGSNNVALAEYGTFFNVEPHGDGLFKMIGDKCDSVQDSDTTREINLDIEVRSDEQIDIDNLDYSF